MNKKATREELGLSETGKAFEYTNFLKFQVCLESVLIRNSILDFSHFRAHSHLLYLHNLWCKVPLIKTYYFAMLILEISLYQGSYHRDSWNDRESVVGKGDIWYWYWVLSKSWCLIWYLKLLLVLCSNLLLLLNYGSSVFQTDIQFSINPFDFSNLLPDENETFKRMCLHLIKVSFSLQVDESKHREKRLWNKCLFWMQVFIFPPLTLFVG